MRPMVNISSNGMKGGGFLTVNHPNGQIPAILAPAESSGAVIGNDTRGKLVTALPDPKAFGREGE